MSHKPSQNSTEAFIQNLRHVELTKTEAQSMRERLIAYSDLHAVEESAKESKPIKSFYFSYSRMIIAASLVLVILVSGTGVSYAAEGTLPGQILYPVKVSIIEPLQGALITSQTGQAAWQSELADRRLTEASTLAAQNDLATSTQEYLEQAATEHVALAQQAATNLADSGNAQAALQVRSDLEAHLSAHADFFALIAPRLAEGGDATTTDAVIALLQGVEKDRTQVELSREATEAALASTTLDAAIAINDESPSTDLALEDSASSTPSERKVIAYVEAESSNRHAEENDLLFRSASLLKLLPAASTTASTTATSTWTTASSTEATTSLKFLLRLHNPPKI